LRIIYIVLTNNQNIHSIVRLNTLRQLIIRNFKDFAFELTTSPLCFLNLYGKLIKVHGNDCRDMATKEFKELTLYGHNYPTWVSNIEITFASHGIVDAIAAPMIGAKPINDVKKNIALFLLRLYIHKDLKQEYLMKRCTYSLWQALKELYEQQKELIWISANHEWNHLRLQDFKTIAKYNHALHSICSMLKFCEKEPSEAEKIEKTLSTMLLEDKYCITNIALTISSNIFNIDSDRKHHELILGCVGCNDRTGQDGTIPQIRLFGLGSRVGTRLSQCCLQLSLKIGGTREDARGRPCPGCPATKRTIKECSRAPFGFCSTA
jgi:hypothetical protein